MTASKTSSRAAGGPANRSGGQGFTLIELLVVIAVIAILGCLTLGAASASRGASQTVQCLQNNGQLMRALTMYTSDSHGWMPPNEDDGGYGNWLGGTAISQGTFNDPTNYGLLNNTYAPAAHAGIKGHGPSALGGYISDYRLAHCPADPSRFGANGADPAGTQTNGSWGPRVRTCSMNGGVGTLTTGGPVSGPWLTGSYGGNQPGRPYNTYGNLRTWANPGPANTFVIADEDPYSINDGGLQVSCALPDQMIDWPASFHDHGGCFAFADGHAIIKHWVDARTYSIETSHQAFTMTQPMNPDIEWLHIHASGSGNGAPLPLSTNPSP